MRKVHVECLPDEALVKVLGITRRMVTHHNGKSRVFSKLITVNNEIAVVDEDPGSAKTTYEKNLSLIDESNGIKRYKDQNGNVILVLKGKLEDWMIENCKASNINILTFGLPERPNELHGVINQRLRQFENLIIHLRENNNLAIHALRKWLN